MSSARGCEVCVQTTPNFIFPSCAFSHPEYCGVPTCTLCEDLPSRAVSLPPAFLLSAYCLWVVCCSLVSTSHVEWSHELQIWQMLIYRLFLSLLPFLTSNVLILNSYIVRDASHVVDCSFSVSPESIHPCSPFEFSEQDSCCYSVSMMMMWLTWSLIPVVGGVRPATEHFLPY